MACPYHKIIQYWPYFTWFNVLVTLLLIFGVRYLIKRTKSYYLNKFYKKKVAEVVAKRDIQFENFINSHRINLDSEGSRKILNSNAYELVEMLKKQQVTSEQLVITFANQIYKERYLNLYADCNFKESLRIAKEKDRITQSTLVDQLPPLHGLPMSFKDQLHVKGFYDTGGFAVQLTNKKNPRKDYSPLCQSIIDAGVVPLVKSNIMLGYSSYESCNNIWGYARNPYNERRTAGGSSGGEAGLIATHGSPLGLGTDIGGSIRIPAYITNQTCLIFLRAFCGCYGFKPTPMRSSTLGILGIDGRDYIALRQIQWASGPLGRSVTDLKLYLKNSFGHVSKYDPYTCAMPFNQETYENTANNEKLKIAYLVGDDIVQSSMPIQNTILEAVHYLKEKGHEVEVFPTNNFSDILINYFKIFAPGKKMGRIVKGLQGETITHLAYQNRCMLDQMPHWLIYILSSLLRLFKQDLLAKFMQAMYTWTFEEYEEHNRIRERHKHEFAKIWNEKGYDALILPAGPLPATILGKSVEVNAFFSTSILANYYSLPAGIVPIRLVKEDEQFIESTFFIPYFNFTIRQNSLFDKILNEHIKDMSGLPTCVQVVGLCQQDEKVLGVMKILEDHFDFFSKYNQV